MAPSEDVQVLSQHQPAAISSAREVSTSRSRCSLARSVNHAFLQMVQPASEDDRRAVKLPYKFCVNESQCMFFASSTKSLSDSDHASMKLLPGIAEHDGVLPCHNHRLGDGKWCTSHFLRKRSRSFGDITTSDITDSIFSCIIYTTYTTPRQARITKPSITLRQRAQETHLVSESCS